MNTIIERFKDLVLNTLSSGNNDQQLANLSQEELDAALIDACQKEDLALVEKLLTQGANPSTADQDHYHPMLIAALRERLDIAQVLLKNGAFVDQKGAYGRNALMAAAQSGNMDLIQILIEAKADVNAADDDNNTPLILATSSQHKEVIMNLIKNGADIHRQGFRRQSSLDIAKERRMKDIVKFMEDANQLQTSTSTPVMHSEAGFERPSFRQSSLQERAEDSVATDRKTKITFMLDPNDLIHEEISESAEIMDENEGVDEQTKEQDAVEISETMVDNGEIDKQVEA